MFFLIQIIILIALDIFLWRINEKDYNLKQFYAIVIIVSTIYGLYLTANALLTFVASIILVFLSIAGENVNEFLLLGNTIFLFVEYFVILGLFIRYAYHHFEKRGQNIALTILISGGITLLPMVLLLIP